MVAADVGYTRGVELDAGGARLSQRMAGNFDHGVRAILGGGAHEPIGQCRCGRSGHVAGFNRDAVAVHDGASHPHAETRGFQNTGDQPACACLSIGARDADHPHSLAGVAGQGLADAAESGAAIGHDAHRCAGGRNKSLGQNRRCAALDGLRHVVVAIDVAAHQGHEQIARAAGARIGSASLDDNVVGSDKVRIRQQVP